MMPSKAEMVFRKKITHYKRTINNFRNLLRRDSAMLEAMEMVNRKCRAKKAKQGEVK